jgi:hypothetical protein
MSRNGVPLSQAERWLANYYAEHFDGYRWDVDEDGPVPDVDLAAGYTLRVLADLKLAKQALRRILSEGSGPGYTEGDIAEEALKKLRRK